MDRRILEFEKLVERVELGERAQSEWAFIANQFPEKLSRLRGS